MDWRNGDRFQFKFFGRTTHYLPGKVRLYYTKNPPNKVMHPRPNHKVYCYGANPQKLYDLVRVIFCVGQIFLPKFNLNKIRRGYITPNNGPS